MRLVFIDNSICDDIDNNDKKKYFVLYCLHKKLDSPQYIIDQIQSDYRYVFNDQDYRYVFDDQDYKFNLNEEFISHSDYFMEIVSKEDSMEYSRYCLALILSLYIYYKILETYLSVL